MVTVEANFILGYATFVGAYILVCLIIILTNVIISSKSKLRRWCVKRSYRKQRKNLKANLKFTRPQRQKRIRESRQSDEPSEAEWSIELSSSSDSDSSKEVSSSNDTILEVSENESFD